MAVKPCRPTTFLMIIVPSLISRESCVLRVQAFRCNKFIKRLNSYWPQPSKNQCPLASLLSCWKISQIPLILTQLYSLFYRKPGKSNCKFSIQVVDYYDNWPGATIRLDYTNWFGMGATTHKKNCPRASIFTDCQQTVSN